MRNIRGTLVAILVTLAFGLTTTACTGVFAKVAVKAVARGAPAAAPFFSEALRLGTDTLVGEALGLEGGTKKGDQPGLYGGSRNKTGCAKSKLARFLKDPAHRRKAAEWARVQGIDVDDIEGFVKRLTPVVLRNDTLVKNHDYKKGKAVAFDALLEAGIAVLVDLYGKPVVQCSCGNPLGAFEHDVDKADVTFKGESKKWTSYDREKVVKIEPTAVKAGVKSYQLVDVDRQDAGIVRLPGTDGTRDEPLPDDPGAQDAEVAVPTVTDMPVEEATQILTAQGLKVQTDSGLSGSDGDSVGAAPGTVLGQSPAADEQVAKGTTVTLTVAPGAEPSVTESPSPTSSSPPSSSSSPTDDTGTAIDTVTTMVIALADAPVRESPSSTSSQLSHVTAGGQYPATCYGSGETTNAHGSTSDIWVQLSLKSGGFGWVTATALQEDPAAGSLGQC
ncbi:PASTA domain-containing protein [Streptomyces canus]|uniref:PASTA domain-containing protein n=1 Tax=Streptomyces canus TaxID=58343 RepID=UPI0033BB25A8